MKPYPVRIVFYSAVFLLVYSFPLFAVPVAFPGAEGSGRFAIGGRGGTVYEVTNLNNSGPGSIVDALSAGNRTVVFRVSGTIDLGGVILEPKSYTTIAGQTAPGDGICLKGRIHIKNNVSNIIIRYLRVRVDEGAANSSGDAIDIDKGSHILIDHVSASYGRDETISCQDGSDNVTVQWCILSEALTFEDHSYGALVRGQYGEQKTYHHNLFLHNKGRNPRPGNYRDMSIDPEGLYFDFRNNVVYNWSGTHPGYNADSSTISRYNFVGNVFIRGSGSSGYKAFKEDAKYAYAYWSGNAHGTNYNTVSVFADQWDLVTFNDFSPGEIDAYKARSAEISMEPVLTTSAFEALDDVLADAGASIVRDAIDLRLVSDVINGTGTFLENTSDLADPWPALQSLPAPADSDHDGMPDSWELARELNPYDDSDRNNNDLHLDYTNLEVYLNELVEGDLEAPANPTGLAATAGDGTAGLDWNDNSEIDLAGYHVYRSTTSGSGYVKLNSSLLIGSAYTDESAVNGTTYYYVVTAVDHSSNESNYSNEAFATPIDLNFYGDSNGDQFIDLTDLSAFVALWLESDCLATSGWDINGDCRVNYEEFRLLASLWMLDRVAPDAPANLSADSGDGAVLLNWEDNSEADLAGYHVYRSETSGSGYVKINASLIEFPEFLDETVTNGTVYYYAVTAVDQASNESAFSNEVIALPNPPTTSLVIQENETGLCGFEGIVDTKHAGYTGDGFIDTTNVLGSGIDTRLHVLTEGVYTFVWRFANGSTSARPGTLIINGATEVSAISFPATGAWTDWDVTSGVTVTLTAGLKDIRLEATGSDGLANIDFLQVSGVNLAAAECP